MKKSDFKLKFSIIFFLLFFICNQELAYTQSNKAFSKFLPKPTGNYKIGTTVFFINDSNRNEIYTRKKNDFRRLLVKAWYPADNCNIKPTKYLSGYSNLILSMHFVWLGATPGYFKKLSNSKTNSYSNIPVSNKEKKYPVIIFSHGYGISLPQFYSSLLENLASHGYIVLAIEHPCESIMIKYPDKTNTRGKNIKNLIKFNRKLKKFRNINLKSHSVAEKIKLIEKIKKEGKFINRSHVEWVKDSKYVTDMLYSTSNFNWKMLSNKFDTEKIGALGHSFGGSVTGQFCLEDSRIKTGINLEGWQYGDVFEKGHNCPFMFIGATHNNWFKLFYSKSKSDYYNITIPKMQHFSFSDLSVMPKIPNRTKIKHLGTIKSEQLIQLSNSLILNFFDHYLKFMPLNMNLVKRITPN